MTDELQTLPALPEHIPDVRGTALENSPHLRLIYHMLCSNWAPYRVALELKRRYGVEVPPEALEAFLRAIPEEDLLPTTSLIRHLRNNNVISDVYMELHALARYSGERLAHAVEVETKEGEGLSQSVEAALSRHWKRLMELQTVEQEMYAALDPHIGDDEADEAPTFAQLLGIGAKKVTIRAAELTVEEG